MSENIQIGLPAQNATVFQSVTARSATTFYTPTLIHRSVHAAPTAVFTDDTVTDCPNT